MFAVTEEEDEDGDDESELGDDDGNIEGALDFKTLPSGRDSDPGLADDTEWKSDQQTEQRRNSRGVASTAPHQQQQSVFVDDTYALGSLSARVKHLRLRCTDVLGPAVFATVYALCRDQYSDADADVDAASDKLAALKTRMHPRQQAAAGQVTSLVEMEQALL
jgi:hypothetical protein